jgi:cytosol alanyl aminopeptidase
MKRLLPALMLLAACKSAPVPAPQAEEKKSTPAPAERALEAPKLRLPAGVKPTGYTLDVRVVPGEENLTGTIVAQLELSSATDILWLNARDITPTSASVTTGVAPIAAQTKVVGEHHLAIVLPNKIGPGSAQLTVSYQAILSRKDTAGFFQLKEGDESYAYTHFEPLDARRAFPCFDEPGFKVPWQVTMHVKKEHVALSNTPVLSETDEPNGMKAVIFATTRPLPSYLISMAAGPFELADAGKWGQNKTPIRIVVPKGKLGEAKWAVESSGQILEVLEKYFGMPYPYEKLDQISLQTNTGAMENPGLITYGHQLILSKPEQDTPGRQRGFAGVCAHEMAHLWFGDLVTMAWWDDLWLNEAFATWMTLKVIQEWRPKWDADVGQVTRRSGALSNDGLVNARKIRQPIVTNDDIQNAFDGITYGKGASVISMFEQYVGAELFQKGVRRYLAEHAHKNATAADFLSAISKEAGKDVAAPWGTFLDQPGAPRISMKLSCEKGKPPALELSQRRHLPVGSKGDTKQLWQVPVCVRWSQGGKEGKSCTLFSSETAQLPLEGAKACPDWVLPNDGMLGYYRSSLEGTSDAVTGPAGRVDVLALLEKAGKKLSVPERVGVMGDLSALVGSGDVDVAQALSVIPAALKEDNRHVLSAALNLGWSIPEDMLPDALRPKLADFLKSTFGPRAQKLGVDVAAKDDEDVRLLRPGMFVMVARDGKDAALRTKSVQLAKAWLADRKAIHPDMIDPVLSVAADTGDVALHDALLAAAKTEKDRADRNRMLGALASYRSAEVVKGHLPVVLGTDFDTRDAMRLLWGASQSYLTRDTAVEFLKSNWDGLIAKLPKESGASLVWVAAGGCDAAKRDDARAYFDGRSTKYMGGPRNFAIAMEAMDLCIAWRERQRASAVAFLEKWKPGAALAPKR